MLVFLDTEFTDFVRPDLISLALVSEDGPKFYAERADYRREYCSDFVRETVLPVLGRVPDAACSRPELTERLHAWFERLTGLELPQAWGEIFTPYRDCLHRRLSSTRLISRGKSS